MVRRGVLACLALVLPCWFLSTDLPYAMAAGSLDLAPLNLVSTSRSEAGLVISVRPVLVPALEVALAQHHAHATFAFSSPVSSELLGSITRAKDGVLPALGSGRLTSWLRTRDRLNDLSVSLGVSGDRYYLAPPVLTFGRYLLARWQGNLPIAGSRLDLSEPVSEQGFRRGEVIVEETLAALAHNGLAGVSFEQLLDSR